MKAIIYEQYGGPEVLRLKEVGKPIPKENEVLVKIHATCLNAADWRIMKAEPFLARFYAGLLKPKFNILGSDIAGTIEAVGKDVQEFAVNDEVFGGLIEFGWGGLAEYVCVPENALVRKPATLSFEKAATIPVAGVTALHALRDRGNVKPGQTVLINGSGGGVGTFAVQLAKHFGADVTAVCSTANAKTALDNGANRVIDYTKVDFTKNRQRYDLILGVNGYHPLTDYRNALNPGGRYVMVGGTTRQLFEAIFLARLLSLTENKSLSALSVKTSEKDHSYLAELMASGVINPVIDRRYPLEETQQAFRHLIQGHTKGKIIISVTKS